MKELRYRIKVNDVVIATFLNEYDRDIAQEALANAFEDADLFIATEIE